MGSQGVLSPRSGGEILKSKYSQYIIRILILLGTATSLAFLLLAWTQPFDLHSLALQWDKNHSVFPCQQSQVKIVTRTVLPPLPSPEIKNGSDKPSPLPSPEIRNGSDKPSPLPSLEIKNGSDKPSKEFLRKRGVGLLHAWTDSELFLRAVTAEKTLAGEINSTSRTPKIAFMFLIRNDLPFAPLWNKFFKGHEDLYNVYVHMWPLKLHAFQQSKGVFWGRVIPSQEGNRNTPGLIADGRRLLANALLDDPSNEWFAIISESCVPLHGFRHVYDTLASTNKSFVDVWDKHWDMWNRYKARGDNAMRPEIEFSQFRIGSQFWVMRRRHAAMTVGDSRYWRKFNKPCMWEYRNCFPEEHYFATLMNILDPHGMYHTATLVDWSKMEDGGHPRRFRTWEISKSFIQDLQKRGNGAFLFARKFDRDCLDSLLDVADAILDH